MRTLEEKFNALYLAEPMSGCWLWEGRVHSDRKPYGYLSHAGKGLQAHRVSYELFRGPIPANTLVCHRCDNPSCVNPDHLFLGTPQINSRDMVVKGRSKAGTKNASAKLDEVRVAEIRAASSGGENKHSLARRFNVSRRLIQLIMKREVWPNV